MEGIAYGESVVPLRGKTYRVLQTNIYENLVMKEGGYGRISRIHVQLGVFLYLLDVFLRYVKRSVIIFLSPISHSLSWRCTCVHFFFLSLFLSHFSFFLSSSSSSPPTSRWIYRNINVYIVPYYTATRQVKSADSYNSLALHYAFLVDRVLYNFQDTIVAALFVTLFVRWYYSCIVAFHMIVILYY